MRFEDGRIESIGDLIGKMKADISDYKGPIWYRGQSKSTWKLKPRLMRRGSRTSESHLINRFKQNATSIITQTPQGEFEWLFIMQHHSVPTRLLDWSESPLVALFFAVSEGRSDAALWLLQPCVLNEKSNFRPEFKYEIPSFDDVHLTNYLPATISGERNSRLFPIAAIAPRNSSRMQA